MRAVVDVRCDRQGIPMDRIRTRHVCPVILFFICVSSTTGSPTTELVPHSERSTSERDTIEGTALQTYRRSRMYRRGQDDSNYFEDHDHEHHDDEEMDDHDDMKAMSQPKVDYWGGYYDFLINEGSYKFWAVFQLATAALLIYSGFAALYYAKINPQPIDEDYADIFRRRRSVPIIPEDEPFLGLDSGTFQRIIDAIARESY